MSEPTLPKKYGTPEAQRLTEAVSALRGSPAFKILQQAMVDLLEQRKDELVRNTTAAVPTLQGRAQQLIDIIDILNRKTT